MYMRTHVNSPLNNTRSEQNKLIAAVRFCFVTRNATSTDRSRGVHTSITIIVNKYPINLCLQIYSSGSNSSDLREQSFCNNCNSRIALGWDEKRSAKNNVRTKAIDCVSIIVIARVRIGASARYELYYWLGFHHSTLFMSYATATSFATYIGRPFRNNRPTLRGKIER